jgi:hypothetical protein
MLPTRVAIVPYNDPPDQTWLDAADLLHVASALQIQAARDLGRVWGVPCVVSPFLRLTDVPPGYAVLAIVQRPQGTPGPLGFHMPAGTHPFALVEYGDDWSLLASHELMEMLCDPWGVRTAPGESLRPGQGQVEYLVEVCDPCQHSTYTINGVLVSDFVTPAYYGPVKARDSGYSFTGRVTGPRELLDGGYITWRTHDPDQQMWQAFAPDTRRSTRGSDYPARVLSADLEIGRVFPSTFSREWVDAHTTSRGSKKRSQTKHYRLPSDEPYTAARAAYDGARRAAEQYGKTLEAYIADILAQLRQTLTFKRDRSRALLKELQDDDGRKGFAKNARAVDARLNNCGLTDVTPKMARPTLNQLPSPDRYKKASKAYEDRNRFGVDFNELDKADLAEWLCWLGGF